MPSFNIIVESEIKDSFRVSQVGGMFDMPHRKKSKHEWHGELPLDEKEWQIGLITGASGSGKTTIAKNVFEDKAYHNGFKWSKDKAIIDCFRKDLTAKEITLALSSVGFSSPPSWIKSFHVLSTGERFRCELARVLCDKRDLIVFDEFTSVVDRVVAKIASAAVSKAIKRNSKKFVAVSCHEDITEWLEPDWIYKPETNEFQWVYLQRPKIELQIYRVNPKAWELFKEHHYLSASLNHSARCFIAFWNDRPVAFASALPLIGFKRAYREHRTVVLPDFQGIGIGTQLSDCIAQMYVDEKKRYRSTSLHPSFVWHRNKSKKWRLIRSGHVSKSGKMKGLKTSANRLTTTFEYVGNREQ